MAPTRIVLDDMHDLYSTCAEYYPRSGPCADAHSLIVKIMQTIDGHKMVPNILDRESCTSLVRRLRHLVQPAPEYPGDPRFPRILRVDDDGVLYNRSCGEPAVMWMLLPDCTMRRIELLHATIDLTFADALVFREWLCAVLADDTARFGHATTASR